MTRLKWRRFCLCAGFLAVLAGQAVAGRAQVGSMLPVDEASRDPEFFVFRARLQEAVARHDLAAVLEVADPQIRNSFGGNGGIDEFRSHWDLPSDKSELWTALGFALGLGGIFHDENTFTAPYLFGRFPEDLDAFDHLVLIGSDVRVRAEPRLGSKVLAVLSFDIVRYAREAEERLSEEQSSHWTAVALRDGRVGYVASRYLRSSIDYRALFERKDGRWRLTAFIGGD